MSEQKQVSKTNGTPALPDDRKAAVAYGLEQFQVMAHSRDNAIAENHQLRADISGYKIALEAMQTQLANADSRVAELTIVRDQAVAKRAAVEAALESMLAIGRAFRIANVPLVEPEPDPEEQ